LHSFAIIKNIFLIKGGIMKIMQSVWTKEVGWSNDARVMEKQKGDNRLVMVFGDTEALRKINFTMTSEKCIPAVMFLVVSTAGEICGTRVFDHSLVATCIDFEKSYLSGSCINLNDFADSFQAGKKLGRLYR
jgi:hypothetical protein